MPIQYATGTTAVIQYDGSNSAELVTIFEGLAGTEADIQSETGGVLSLEVTYWEGGGNVVGVGTPIMTPLTIETDDWVTVDIYPTLIPAADFAERWILKL
jgi:hypothetical protein